MKIKADFITNSSSASFTILKKHLTLCQIDFIHEHVTLGMIIAKHKHKQYISPAWWQITETDDVIQGYTGMDNFDMMWFLNQIGIKGEYIEYDSS